MDEALLQKIVSYPQERGSLIPILQEVQDHYGYLPEEVVGEVADQLRISEHEVYGVATFYAQFRFNKPGKHLCRVCQGTACHVRGGRKILDTVMKDLGISHGETTKDELFSLEEVACLGCCALAPVVMVDDKVFGNLSMSKVKDAVERYKEGGSEDE